MEAVWQYGQRSGRHLRLAVQTNGTLLTPQTLRALRRMGCALGVSLDGNGDANGLRVFPDGKPAFSSIIEGIREVARAGMRCNLTAVVSDVSAPHLGGLLELALWLGCVGGIGLDLFRPMGRGAIQDHAPSPEQLDHGLRALLNQYTLLRELGVPLVVKELERIRRLQDHPGVEEAYCYAQTESGGSGGKDLSVLVLRGPGRLFAGNSGPGTGPSGRGEEPAKGPRPLSGVRP